MDNKFEDLIKAIKESNEPVKDLAATLKKQLTPVKGKVFYNTNIEKISIGDRTFSVKLTRRENDIVNFNLMYQIDNEVNADANCVSLSKGMVYKTSEHVSYVLTNAFVAEDTLILNFTIFADTNLLED